MEDDKLKDRGLVGAEKPKQFPFGNCSARKSLNLVNGDFLGGFGLFFFEGNSEDAVF